MQRCLKIEHDIKERGDFPGRLRQIHHQWPGRTEMCAQRMISSIEEMTRFIEDVKTKYPLPHGAQWMVCEEGSEFFVKKGVPDANDKV